MIQRIQTLYLVMAGIFPAITFFFPVMLFYREGMTFSMSSWGYTDVASLYADSPDGMPYGLLALTILSMIASFVAVGGYKNRRNQLKQTNRAIATNIVWYAVLAVYTYLACASTDTHLAFTPCVLLPVLSLVCLVLAKHAIRKDEALVRAADRIR